MAKHDEPGRTRMRKVFGWLVVAFGLCLGVVAGGIAMQAILQHRGVTDVVASDVGAFVIESPQEHFHKDRIALLLLGIDYNYDAKDQEYSKDARTDTIKAVSLDLPTPDDPSGRIAILSIPRDTDVVMPSGREDKINAAYAGFDDPSRAAHASERVVADFLGIPRFDRFVTLRIDATKDLIDAIGGIDVVPDETMNYDDSWGHLHIHFTGGKRYHMTGDQAVSYSRFRHDACGDPCRIRRQDQVIRIALAKLKNDRVNDVLHLQQLIAVVRRNVYTDLSEREILSLGWAFAHVDLSKLRAEQVPYVADKDLACCGNVLIADDAAKNALVKKLFLAPLAPGAPPDARAVAAVLPANVRIDVENGSGVSGMGARVAARLRKLGFVVDGVRNADSFAYDATEIHVHSASTPLAGERVRSALAMKTATVQSDPPRTGGDVTVIVGRDLARPPQNEASAIK